MENVIHVVKVIPSRKICDERGMIMHMLKVTDDKLRWNDA